MPWLVMTPVTSRVTRDRANKRPKIPTTGGILGQQWPVFKYFLFCKIIDKDFGRRKFFSFWKLAGSTITFSQ